MRLVTAVFFASLFTASAAYPADWTSYGSKAQSGPSFNDFSMEFHCEYGKPEFLLKYDSFLGLHGSKVKVTLQETSKPGISFSMLVFPDDDTSAYTGDAREIAELMMGASLIMMTVTPEYRNKMYSAFTMEGSDYAIYRVFETCNQTLEGPKPPKPAIKSDKKESKPDSEKYAALIRERIYSIWYPPSSATDKHTTRIVIGIQPTGEIDTISIDTSSGDRSFDVSALSAVRSLVMLPVPADSDTFERYFRKFTIDFNRRGN
ncbi:TolA protein [Marinobacter sp. LV10R520-4]|nr:TolA protein [Marinobacter sp. LV10R520-4]